MFKLDVLSRGFLVFVLHRRVVNYLERLDFHAKTGAGKAKNLVRYLGKRFKLVVSHRSLKSNQTFVSSSFDQIPHGVW